MKHVHCPINDWNCPCIENILLESGELHAGCCLLYPDCNPYEECDDFFASVGDEEENDFVDEHN